MELILHCSDISNPFKPYDLCAKWADLVVEVSTHVFISVLSLRVFVSVLSFDVFCSLKTIPKVCEMVSYGVFTRSICIVTISPQCDSSSFTPLFFSKPSLTSTMYHHLPTYTLQYRSSVCRATRRSPWAWRCPPCAIGTPSLCVTCRWASSSSSSRPSSSVCRCVQCVL